MNKQIAIVGLGCTTPIGYSAKETAASVRAGIVRFQETACYDRFRDPIVMSCFPTDALPSADPLINQIPGIGTRKIRMLQMAGSALLEAIVNIPDTENCPVFLGMPEILSEDELSENPDFLNLLSNQCLRKIDYSNSRLYPDGRASVALALYDAKKLLETDEHEFMVVGGCDSFFDFDLLKKQDIDGKICTSFNLNGLIPGEGAGFIVLCTLETAMRHNLKNLSVLNGVGSGKEYEHGCSADAHKGSGMADAFSTLFANAPMNGLVKTIYVDFNGMSLHASQWGYAYRRNSNRFCKDAILMHPGECLGDTGAAAGVIMAILAIIGLSRNYIEGPCMVSCSSDLGNYGVYTLNLENE